MDLNSRVNSRVVTNVDRRTDGRMYERTENRIPISRHAWGRRAKNQGPVVQSIVSLTSSLKGQLIKCFMTL